MELMEFILWMDGFGLYVSQNLTKEGGKKCYQSCYG